MNDTLGYLLYVAVGVGVLLLQRFVLGNRPKVWIGALLPAALLAATVFFGVQGHLDGLREWVVFGVGVVALCGVWGSGQESRRKHVQSA